ncbi:MAG: histone deacetylase [Planctomycetota bacterium]|nr:histone deacetylase [Planctomycetota bacterium]
MRPTVFYHESSLRHDTGSHPETAARVERILDHLHSASGGLDLRSPRAASPEDVGRVHTETHIARIRDVAHAGGGHLDADTVVSPDSYTAALYAAGATLSAIDAVLAGDAPAAFALVRPPGHHARAGVAMGFCLFNNVAIGARYLVEEKGLSRVAIVDWDVHHGNGTQETFYRDGKVFYLSLHRHPFYPGTGAADERGAESGAGTTLNVPLPATTSSEEYRRIFGEAMGEVADFRPEFVLISAGFDAYREDPIAGLNLDIDDYGDLAARVRVACSEARGIVSSLEGGYNLEALPKCVAAHLDGLDE